MQRLAAFCVLMAATTVSVVAAPPYEPVKRSSSASPIDPSSPYYSPSQNEGAGAVYGSGVKTYGTGGTDGGDTSYAKPAESARPSTYSSASTAGFDSYSYMQQMQQMQQEIQELRGAVEQLTHDMEMMQKQARERYLDLDSRINQLRGGTAAAAGAAVAVDQAGSPAAGSAVESTGEDKDLYDKASQLRRDGKYEESIAVLEDLLKRSPEGLYAPYCEYWLGETYMALKPPKMDVAKTHFISLLGNHPDHVKVPDAMYKLGKLFASQGENSKAKSTLNELIKKHPDKPAANLAKDLLKTL
ncbi:MAG TPA: YbgF trimerization domain-containing protein [Candidatus Kapabacteria bacterium]|nr:YbgF trimerization domain-containing protein [Candidatus Kapabacteria bacterium]